MVKRARNKIGQFIPISSVAKNPNLPFEKILHRALSILVAIFLLLLVSPWMTLAIKSKTVKEWAYAIIDFCNSHFVAIDESTKGNNSNTAKKDPNEL